MNVLMPEQRVEEPCPPATPSARVRHLEFNDVRAGRLVAESLNATLVSAVEYLERAIIRGMEVWEVVVRDVPVMSGAHIRRVAIRPLPRRLVDTDLAGILLPRATADIDVVVNDADDDDDDAIVQWFVEQHTVATQEATPLLEVAHKEKDEDVMLTLPNGPGSTRSWRGGGTMRQR